MSSVVIYLVSQYVSMVRSVVIVIQIVTMAKMKILSIVPFFTEVSF